MFSTNYDSISAFEKLPIEFMSNCVYKTSLSEKFAKQILSWKFYSNCEMNFGNFTIAEIFLWFSYVKKSFLKMLCRIVKMRAGN